MRKCQTKKKVFILLSFQERETIGSAGPSKKLLVSIGSSSGVDKVPNEHKYEIALKGNTDLNKKIIKLGDINELAYESLIVFINTSSFVGKVVLGFVKNTKSEDFLEGNCKVVWDWLVLKYAPHTASSLLKLKSEFHNSKLESIEKDHDELISHLEGLQIQMDKIRLKGSITDKDFMIHILNNLHQDYDVILHGLENHLTATRDDVLAIDVICEKMNHRHEKLKTKTRKKSKKKRP